ncbi:uncharacterized protein [Palaemon carinicauda]|uniref:uncharacterized protein n=1 Tax=Palaemon carinicauda TaxID=392227 RepID=UPI0035B5F970
MVGLSEVIRNEELWELLYVDYLLIIVEMRKAYIERRQQSMERGGLRVNVDKTEVMVKSKESRGWIAIHESRGSVIKEVEQFRYLESTKSQEGGCKAEVGNGIKAAWGKWMEVAGVVCDKKMPIRLKVKIHKIVIRPVLMYGS